MVALTVRLPDEDHERLRRVAFEKHWPVAYVIRLALAELLDKIEAEV